MKQAELAVSCAFLALVFAGSTRGEERSSIRFETDVRPIFKAHCWQCHGEEGERKGGFDARLARFVLKGGDSGPAVVPGKHGESLVYERVASGEMPPGKKKLAPGDIETIARWIDEGATTVRPEPETLAAGDSFTEEERNHWSFRPIRRPAIPNVKAIDQLRSPIDAFLLARLEQSDLSFGQPADKATLIRRLYFDLIGLPPAPETVDRFVADPAPEAYDRLVEELLASPAYGERWARHWLDVAGYADSDGYTEQDPERKWAWRYRDYVIRAFNGDKPWNEFLVEQLAGDELLAFPYANLTPDQAERLIATGFLRMGPDGTAAGAPDQNVAKNDVLAETIKIVSTSVLGLTVGCAQCHDHRYDPIAQADYYRVRALFEPAYDVAQWRVPDARLVSLWSDETRRQAAAAEQELQEISRNRTAELDALVNETFERELAKLPAEIQPLARAARAAPADKRTEAQRQLIKDYPFLNVDRGSVYLYLPDRLTNFNKKWDETTEIARRKRPADDNVMCLTEVPGQAPATRLFARGDLNQPRQEIAPGELAVLNVANAAIPVDDPQIPTTGRRLAYARHLTSGRHPLVARVLVNRIWLHHFGRGLVATPSDFGALGERPTHPELLDWLADDFMQGGWLLKRLQRLIVTSAAYRQTSARRDALETVDPDNRLLGRMPVRRLEAETIRDSLLALGDRLTNTMYGPPVPVMPDEVGQVVVGIDTRDSAGRPSGKFIPLGAEEFRRSLYIAVRRSMPLGVLEPFDMPLLTPNCELRTSSTVAPQSLLMINGAFVIGQAESIALRVRRDAGTDPFDQMPRAWRLIYGRSPTDREMAYGLVFLLGQTRELTAAQAAQAGADAKAAPLDPSLTALAHFCHALVSSNGFLYVD